MSRRAARAAAAVVVATLVAGCSADGAPGTARSGERVEVLAAWAGWEQERFAEVLDAFERTSGARVVYTTAHERLPEVLRERIRSGDPPDVAILPQPGLLRELVDAGRLVPLDRATRALVEQHYSAAFRDLASVGGRPYGVWFKAANKSLVWYHVATFERLGVVPPTSVEGLVALARRFAAEGLEPFAVAGASPWTLTDWFENLYARLEGLEAYDRLADGRTSWDDASVTRTLEVLGRLLGPSTTSELRQDFEAAVVATWSEPSRAVMLMEGDFVAGVIVGSTAARLGIDADAFSFPPGPEGRPAVVGGGDIAVQLRASTTAASLLRFLATPEAAAVWARRGGFLSPNLSLDLAVYPDDMTRRHARGLLEAGDDFRFDLSDLQPASFGGTPTQGLQAELRRFLVERDADLTARRLAEAARSTGPE